VTLEPHSENNMSPCSSPSSGSEDIWVTPKTGLSPESFRTAPDLPIWDQQYHVLSTGSFPSTSILRRKGAHNCTCAANEKHRSLFTLCEQVISPHLREAESPLLGIKVCWNADNIWECKIPREMSGLDKRVRFEDLKTVYQANKVLWKGTYWYSRLFRSGNKDSVKSESRHGLAILRLLAGLDSYSGKLERYQLMKFSLSKGAVQKLRQILATVDGLLMQLVLCFPDRKAIMNWSFMDRVTNSLICCMLPDYFRDKNNDVSRVTTFEKVKRLRKAIKMFGFNQISTEDSVIVPQELSFFRFILKHLGHKKDPISAYRTMTMSQTRASGVPPLVVYKKTMDKIVSILKEPQSPGTFLRFRPFIRPAIEEIYFEVLQSLGGNENRDRFFSRCVSAAKISLSDSGEFFTKHGEGGKLEAARRVLIGLPEVDKIDLNTGQKIGKLVRTNSNQGEMLFYWACNQFHDRNKCYDRNIMSVRISLVAELGKYRAITVSHLAHAVLLHVLSHVLLEFLRVIPSSESGIGAANHAWNFFKRLSHKNPSANFIFGDKDVYLFSTDWEQATDFCDHTVAQALLNMLCSMFGVPEWYRQTCVFALCAPRQVETLDPEERTLEVFYTQRGELMGDPVVKVILHVYHLVCRHAAKAFMSGLRPEP